MITILFHVTIGKILLKIHNFIKIRVKFMLKLSS